MSSHLPATKEIRDLLVDLLGREVEMAPSPPLAPGPARPCTLAVYVDDQLRISAVIAVDHRLSAYAGAAIGLVPVGGAQDAIEQIVMPSTLRENLYEVLNIAAALFNVPGAPHVRLYAVHHVGDPMPGDVQARALTLGRRLDVTAGISGYGGGQLSVVLT